MTQKKKKASDFRVDLSKKHTLSNSKHIYIDPSNLYSLKNYAKPESLDIIFSRNLINSTKFYDILLKEMLIYCKIGGKIILEFTNGGIISYKNLLKEIEMINGPTSIVSNKKGKLNIIVLEKKNPYLNKNDSINKWTFGIITNGKKNDWVEKQIESIKKQKIPNYEIIVCGTYMEKEEKNFRYISFNEKDDLGWITKKKNLICQASKYENLCIIHDRIVLDNSWFIGMKKYGNYFEVLSCIIHDENGLRCGDWITLGVKPGKLPKIGLLEYKDWDKYGYIDGALYILKKSVWKNVKWDERLFWNQAEDLKLNRDWYEKRIIPRFNPFSSCKTLSWRHGYVGKYKFNPYKIGPYSRKTKLKDCIKFWIKKIIFWEKIRPIIKIKKK
jgi:hypothetical protein